MTVFRVYDPEECSPDGRPLDWPECRTCGGSGRGWSSMVVEGAMPPDAHEVPCPTCDGGHGSLEKAALAHLWDEAVRREGGISETVLRCEGCGHPMSEGTWEDDGKGPSVPVVLAELNLRQFDLRALDQLRAGREPHLLFGVTHFSRCNEGCEHGGPGRWRLGSEQLWALADLGAMAEGEPVYPVLHDRLDAGAMVEASWRPVEVRTLGWPMDLRPEKLAVLCLRCWAARDA